MVEMINRGACLTLRILCDRRGRRIEDRIQRITVRIRNPSFNSRRLLCSIQLR